MILVKLDVLLYASVTLQFSMIGWIKINVVHLLFNKVLNKKTWKEYLLKVEEHSVI